MNKVTVTGKSVDEAVQKALKQLNTTKDQVTIKILEEPNKGFLGLIGSKDAKIEAELKTDSIEEARQFLSSVLKTMNLDLRVESRVEEDSHVFEMVGKELGMVIGRRGQTLDSLQYLVNIVANRHSDHKVRIVLDGENYRERRKKTLEALADRLALKVIRTGKNITLEPMNPMERKIIHTFLQSRVEVTTSSIGKDSQRRVVISLVDR